MSDQDIFANQTNSQETPETSQTPDPIMTKLFQIRNENGDPKYKTVEAALDALAASQQFIPTLLSEKQQMQTQLEDATKKLQELGTVDDLLKRMGSQPSKSGEEPKTNDSTPMTEETLTKIVQKVLDTRDVDHKRDQNLKTVIDAVVKTYGDQAGAHIQKRATEMGVTPDHLRDLARSTPSMALELLIPKTKSVVAPSQSSIIPPTQVPTGNEYPTYERGAARGGMSNKELAERWRKSAEYTNKRLGVETS